VRDEAFWDERYRSKSKIWSGQPNPDLVTEAEGLAPGSALDVGCGEGADAIWLAGRGFEVTAVDISAVALARGAAQADEAGPGIARRITWVHADLTSPVPALARYDLVSMQFVQLPPGVRETVWARLAAAVAPGGTLLIVGHHPADLQTTAMRPPEPELFFTPGDVAAALDPRAFQIVVSEARERGVTDPDGRAITVQDAVLRAQRRASGLRAGTRSGS
jgi:SAM-dependent methyltransferase